MASALGKSAKKRRSVGFGGGMEPNRSEGSVMVNRLSFAKNHLILTQ